MTLDNMYKDYELSSMADILTARYFFIINRRIIRVLDIYKVEDIQPAVRAYLRDEVGLTDEQLDEFVDYMLSDDNWEAKDDGTATGVFSHYSSENGGSSRTDVRKNAVYSLDGRSVNGASKGVYITLDAQGNVRKVMR